MADFDRYQWVLDQPGDWFALHAVTTPDGLTPQEIALTRKEAVAALLCGQAPTPPPPTISTEMLKVTLSGGVNVRGAPSLTGTVLRLLRQGEVITVETTTTTADKIIWRKIADHQEWVAEVRVDNTLRWLAPNA
jgi:hypothetical protein